MPRGRKGAKKGAIRLQEERKREARLAVELEQAQVEVLRAQFRRLSEAHGMTDDGDDRRSSKSAGLGEHRTKGRLRRRPPFCVFLRKRVEVASDERPVRRASFSMRDGGPCAAYDDLERGIVAPASMTASEERLVEEFDALEAKRQDQMAELKHANETLAAQLQTERATRAATVEALAATHFFEEQRRLQAMQQALEVERQRLAAAHMRLQQEREEEFLTATVARLQSRVETSKGHHATTLLARHMQHLTSLGVSDTKYEDHFWSFYRLFIGEYVCLFVCGLAGCDLHLYPDLRHPSGFSLGAH
jgi:hypothetical protein